MIVQEGARWKICHVVGQVALLMRMGKGADSIGVSGSTSLAMLTYDKSGGKKDTGKDFSKGVAFKAKPGDDVSSSMGGGDTGREGKF